MRSFGHQTQSGFTLIELVTVIVIIGLLSATAIPKFQNLVDDAKTGVAQGVGGAAASASAANFAACKGGLTSCVPTVTTCAQLEPLITMPAGFTFTGTGLVATGVPVTCTATDADTPAHTATFSGFSS
jgi:MSHA pilin protein MshA